MLKSLCLVVALSSLAACSPCRSEDKKAVSTSSAEGAASEAGDSDATSANRSAKIDMRRPTIRGNADTAGSGREPPPDPVEAQRRREERRAEFMARVDADGDGTVSDAEREAARQKRIEERNQEMDTDGDGVVSPAERDAAREQRTEEIRQRIDADGDGKLTADELAASSFGRLDLKDVDADKNGDITNAELQAAIRARNERRGFFRPGGRPFGRGDRPLGSAAGSASGSGG